MKRIDRYIAGQFLLYYLACLIGFITMLVVIDISGKINKLAREGHFLVNFLHYYISEIPFILNLLLPIISVMAAIFTVFTLKKRNELVCLLSSGISLHRILLPISGVLILTLSLIHI